MDFGYDILNNVLVLFGQCLNWSMQFYGVNVTVKGIFAFTFSVGLLIIFIRAIRG